MALARRVLDYNYRIFDEHELPVASLVLLADNDPEWRPDSFFSEVLGTVMGISFATAKLLDYANQAEGREEGRKEGAAELLEWQLTQRFGQLPPTYRKKLEKASGEQLAAWGAALLDAPSLKQVFK